MENNGNREYKSDVFSLLMAITENALQVYNINKGKNTELLGRCQILKEYMIFVDYVKEYYKNPENSLEHAIELAIDRCIKEDILKEF